jgi:hypothetical protein
MATAAPVRPWSVTVVRYSGNWCIELRGGNGVLIDHIGNYSIKQSAVLMAKRMSMATIQYLEDTGK